MQFQFVGQMSVCKLRVEGLRGSGVDRVDEPLGVEEDHTSVPAESPPDGVSQVLVPEAVDDWVEEGGEHRVQDRDNDAHLE